MRPLRLYSLNRFLVYHRAVSATVIRLHVMSLVLTYLMTKSLVIILLFLLFTPLAYSNHKSDLSFYEFGGVCFFFFFF